MDSRIIAFHDEEVRGLHEDVVLLDDLSFQRGAGDTESFGRRPDYGSGLEQDDPVLLVGIVPMDWNQVVRCFSSKDAHDDPGTLPYDGAMVARRTAGSIAPSLAAEDSP